MRNKVPSFIPRLTLSLASLGGFIGAATGHNNGDSLGWSLVRGATLFLVFGVVSRWWLTSMSRLWLESRLEALQVKAQTETPAPRPGRF